MIGDVTIKVCGITRAADAAVMLASGADFLGLNVWPGSPRHVPAERRPSLLREIPAAARVAVTVNPTADEVLGLFAEGFAMVQAHFDPQLATCDLPRIAAIAGPDRLWLAPKLPDGAPFPGELLNFSKTFLHDAHSRQAFGGTGKTGDWNRFQSLQASHPSQVWILAGGLGPANVSDAYQTGARFLDLNSGIELAPGLKSAEKMAAVSEALLKTRQS